uniref:Putative regulator of chromosome condensation 1 n=1 Tax=Amblyomma triste TaxID=251400 RepID=A0A023GN11_AMBTT
MARRKDKKPGPSRKRGPPVENSPSVAKRAKVVEKEVVVERRKVPGQVYTVGQGDVGQLGLGPDVMEKSRPAPVPNLDNVVDVVAGGMHTLCLTADGKVWSFGCNDEGALGRQTSSLDGTETTPGQVELPEPVAKLSAGDSHSVALTVSGRAFMWGNFRDSSGQMGLIVEGQAEREPKLVATGIVEIASGSDHVVMLTADGNLVTRGCAEQGQLGRVAAMFSSRGGRRATNYLLEPGTVRVHRPKGCKSSAFDRIWTGAYTTYARLEETGAIYGFGLNNYHQLGGSDEGGTILHMPELLGSCAGHRWKAVSGGQHHALLLNEEGSVFSMGRKEYGRLGLGAANPPDNDDQETPGPVPGLSNCTEISCGEAVSFAVDEEGRLHSWGFGTNGQLGHGEDEDVFEPKVVGGKLTGKKTLVVSGGGQHTVILAS